MQFIPKEKVITSALMTRPWFDDVMNVKGDIPGHSLSKTVKYYKDRILTLMGKLGAGGVLFIECDIESEPPCEGYVITFNLHGADGRIEVAALPVRRKTIARRERALSMALYNIGNWLECEVYGLMFKPNSAPLVVHLIGSNGKTITETLIDRGEIPMLTGGN